MARYSKEIQEISKETKIKQATLHKIKLFYEENKKWYAYFCENPYKCMDIEGFGFKRCDELARKINFDMMSDFRVVACVKHVIEDSASGNTIVEFKKAMEGVIKLLERKDTGRMRKAIIESANKCGYLMYTRDLKRTGGEDVYFITLEWWKETEQDIFKLCKKADLFENKSEEEINNAIEEVEKKLEFPLNERQRKAFMEIPHGKVNVLTGLGGCTDSETNVLTKNGWIKISEWNGQEIMVSEIEYNDIIPRYRFEMPLKYHRYEKSIFFDIILECGNRITVSTEHKNILYKNGLILIKRTFEMINELDFEKDVIEIQVFENRKDGLVNKRVVGIEISEKNKTEKEMFCFTTSTGYFLAKSDGVQFATGNSGKSYTTRAILDVLDKIGETYELMTPTGTSSKILMNSTGRDANTIHRKYYADYKMKQEKVYADWLVIDEVSMLSLEHFRLINSMLHEAPTKLLLIGDINQLQPISVGNPFFDIIKLIESGMIKGNVIHLTEIMRSKKDSAISHICKMFTEHGEYSKAELYKEHKGVEFIPLDKKEFTKQIGAIIKARDFKLNETFVLSPFNVKEFGTNVINNYIQRTFSKGEVVYEDKYKKYKIGDYLMHTKNNSNLGIFNGERIRLVSDLGMRFDDNGNEVQMYLCQKVDEPLVYIEYTDKLLMTQTMLAYAISIHKSQGSSLVNTIVVLDSSHYFSLSRNSVYTGMSRASKNLVVLYDEKALEYASSRNEVERRKTFLREFYNLQMKKREEKGE